MKRTIKTVFCLGLGAILLLGVLGCATEQKKPEPEPEPEPVETAAPIEGGEDTVSLNGESELLFPTLPPEESLPTPIPEPTRPPEEGDVSTERFPNYDTGWDADWSYQSDILRIAIRKHEDNENRLVYYVADVWTRSISSFRIGIGNGKFNTGREDPEDFANRDHAIFGVSGTMNSGLVIHNGEVIKKNIDKSDITFRSGIVIVYKDGSVKMINRTKGETYNYQKENARNGGILHALQFGPVLVQNGEIQKGLRKNERHPRIIFGYCEPGHYIMVAVDGRTKKSIGITESEMAELMLSLGCKDAINLDGGTSAVMLFMGKTINVPSGKDKDGDGVAGRNIVDLLEFAEYDENGNAPALSAVTPDKVYGE